MWQKIVIWNILTELSENIKAPLVNFEIKYANAVFKILESIQKTKEFYIDINASGNISRKFARIFTSKVNKKF